LQTRGRDLVYSIGPAGFLVELEKLAGAGLRSARGSTREKIAQFRSGRSSAFTSRIP